MAHTKAEKTYSQNTGAANTFSYSGSFDVFKGTEVQVELDNVQLTFTASTINESASPREYTVDTSAKTIHIGGADLSSGTIIIRPVTDMGAPTPRATYAPGASVTSEDLNNNQLQLMRKALEYDDQKLSSIGGTMTGHLTMGEDQTIIFEGATDDGYETTLTVEDPTADRTITLPNNTGTVVTTGSTSAVALGMMAVNSVDSDQYVDGSIDLIHMSADSVDTSKIVNNTITNDDINASAGILGTKISPDFGSQNIVTTGNLTTSGVNSFSGQHTTSAGTLANSIRIGLDASGEISTASGDLVLDSAGGTVSVDDNLTVAGTLTASGEVTVNTGIIPDTDEGAYLGSSSKPWSYAYIDEVLIGATNNTITTQTGNLTLDSSGGLIDINDAVDISGNLTVGGSLTFPTASVPLTNIENVSSGQVIVGNGSNRPTAVAMSGDVAIAAGGATTIQSDSIEIGMIGCEQTSITNSDSHIPTSGAVVDYVTDALTSAGSFEVVADEDNFPATHPDPKASPSVAGIAGMVVSIQNAGGLQINSSGVATNARKAGSGSDDITINGFPSSMRGGVGGNADPYELTDETGLLVTTTAQTDTAYASGAVYDFHRVFVKPADYVRLSDDINDFNNRYRIGTKTANDSNTNDDGDLFFDTGANKMYVYDGAYDSGGEWKEVTSAGDFKFLTIKDHDQASGGSGPTFNGSNEEFDLFDGSSDASITSAAQLIVVLNGVVQKPNSGTFSGSEEGFYLNDTHGIKFCDPPPSGSVLFVTQIGTAVALNVPADNSVSGAKIQSGAITGGKCDNPLKFDDNHKVSFGTDGTGDLEIYHASGNSYISDQGAGDLYIQASDKIVFQKADGSETLAEFNRDTTGGCELYYDNKKTFETFVNGVIVRGGDDTEDGEIHLYADRGDDNPDKWRIAANASASRLRIQNYHDGSWETNIEANSNAGVKLDYNNDTKFETTSSGAEVTTTGAVANFVVRGKENYGASLTLASDAGGDPGDYARILQHTDEHLYFQVYNAANTAYEDAIVAKHDGSVELYYDNVKKGYTYSEGWKVNGYMKALADVSDASGGDNEGDYHTLQSSSETASTLLLEHSGNSTPRGIYAYFSDAAPDNATQYFLYCEDNSAIRAKINSNGAFESADNSYGGISDVKLKENIVDAKSQWNDIKALKIRNFNFKRKPDTKLLGVVAQEVESISPGIVYESEDLEKGGVSKGTTTKGVKYSILYMKAIKALQEAMARIETLETKVAALEAK